MIKVAVDVETSGFKPYWHDVITIGMCVYEVQEVFNPIATFYGTCRPYSPANWNVDSEKAHKITLHEAMAHQDDCRSLCVKTLHFLKEFYRPGHYVPFVQHAPFTDNFDYLHTQALFIKAELQFSFYKFFSERITQNTMRMAHEAGYRENSLKHWAPRLNREFVHHNALDDALMAAAIDCYLSTNGGQNELESITQQTQPIQQEGILQIAGLSALPSKGRKRSKT